MKSYSSFQALPLIIKPYHQAGYYIQNKTNILLHRVLFKLLGLHECHSCTLFFAHSIEPPAAALINKCLSSTARPAVRYTCLLSKHVCFQNKAVQCLHPCRFTLCVMYTVCRFIIISVLFPFAASSASNSSNHSSGVEAPASQPTPLKPLERRNFCVGEEMFRLDSVP